MPKPMLVPFEAKHVMMMQNRDSAIDEPWSLALEKQLAGPAFTAIVDGKVLGCAGLLLPWPGIGLAWMELSEEIGTHGRWLTLVTRRGLADLIRVYSLHRVEVVVLADSPRNQQWIEAIGFTRENGRARAYSSDRRDVIRYEWVKEAV